MEKKPRYRDDQGRLVIGSTFLKRFLDDSHCPKKNKAIYIDMEYEEYRSGAMQKGLFFESIVLGSTSDGDTVDSLPKTKAGSVTADEKRIRLQANLANQVIQANGFHFTQNQHRITYELNEYMVLGTTVDMTGTHEDEPDTMVIGDLKLTADINNKYGPYAWGAAEYMDHTQAVLTHFIATKIQDKPVSFYYLVFDYAPNSSYQFFKKRVGAIEHAELRGKINHVIDLVMEYIKAEDDIQMKPTWDNCQYCPLKEQCEMKVSTKPIMEI